MTFSIVSARAYVKNLDTGQVYFTKGEGTQAIASVTKLMMAYVLHQYRINLAALQDLVTIVAADHVAGSSGANLSTGDILTMESLLYNAMLPSSGVSCMAIARIVGDEMSGGGGVARFVEEMNMYAALFGMTSTVYVDPHGTNELNISTPEDQVKLMAQIYSENDDEVLFDTWFVNRYTMNVTRGSAIVLEVERGDATFADQGMVGGKGGSLPAVPTFTRCNLWESNSGQHIAIAIFGSLSGQTGVDLRAIIATLKIDFPELATADVKFTPSHFFTALGFGGGWWQRADISKMSQDAGGAVPVTTDLDPVVRWLPTVEGATTPGLVITMPNGGVFWRSANPRLTLNGSNAYMTLGTGTVGDTTFFQAAGQEYIIAYNFGASDAVSVVVGKAGGTSSTKQYQSYFDDPSLVNISMYNRGTATNLPEDVNDNLDHPVISSWNGLSGTQGRFFLQIAPLPHRQLRVGTAAAETTQHLTFGARGAPAAPTLFMTGYFKDILITDAVPSRRLQRCLRDYWAGNTEISLTLNPAGITQYPPVLWTTDLLSGPKNSNSDTSWGGVADEDGCYVTVYGVRLGAEQGNSTITCCGAAAARVLYWGNAIPPWSGAATLYNAFQKYQCIIFQVDGAAVDGLGEITVTVDGQTSNALAFTVRAGRILFIKTTGVDTTGRGSWTLPLRTIPFARSQYHTAGDILYVGDGVNQLTHDGSGYAARFRFAGTQAAPITLAAYPGATCQIGTVSMECIVFLTDAGVSAAWNTVAKFSLIGQFNTFQGTTGIRGVGNKIQAPNGNGRTGAITVSGSFFKLLANEITNCGFDGVDSLYHVIYPGGSRTTLNPPDATDREYAFNYIHDNRADTAFNNYNESTVSTAHRQKMRRAHFHHNVIVNQRADGIRLHQASYCPNWVHDNLVIRAGGQGLWIASGDWPLAPTEVGQYVYHNTVIDCGALSDPVHPSNKRGWTVTLNGEDVTALFANNLFLQRNGFPFFGVGGGSQLPTVNPAIWTNNLYRQLPQYSFAVPSFESNVRVADPKLVGGSASDLWAAAAFVATFRNMAAPSNWAGEPNVVFGDSGVGDDAHLRPDSPAIGAGSALVDDLADPVPSDSIGCEYDLDGVPRPNDVTHDIGCYEYVS